MDVLPSDTLFMQFDVNDCYASFADEYLVRRMPVPAAMTRSTLLLEGGSLSIGHIRTPWAGVAFLKVQQLRPMLLRW